MLKPFQLHEPTTVEEAISVLGKFGDDASVYAGGTELLLAMKEGLLSYDHLVNIKAIPGLDVVDYDESTGVLTVGATATHRALEYSPLVGEKFSLISDVEHRVANVRVRNVGTLGGNLCFAEPHSDPGVFLLLYDAEVELVGSGGARKQSVEDFILGPYETTREPDELLTTIEVPRLPEGSRHAYIKFGYHERPSLGLGLVARVDNGTLADIRIAVGSVGPKPVRVRNAEERLRGASLADLFGNTQSSALLDEAGRMMAEAAEPVTDLHGSAEYKEHLLRVFLEEALEEATRG
ncbi:MAG: carbon-monoxide dehydrogenase medium subunit [Chloroflexi bacterium]|jgi:carbon-monoxide dehydrogenase medium subunit|nr:MAG: carbon-monoxide dehydrogenase medium subunit [Chloroflexota bacterium]